MKFTGKYIGDAAFYRRALAVAIPIMIQNGITQFVSMLDNIMVGRVGTEQMTGVSIANQLVFVFSLAVFGAVSGAGIFSSQFYGKQDFEGVRRAFRFKLCFCAVLLAAGVGVFLGFGDDLIGAYLRGEGTPEQIEASFGYAKQYLAVMLWGLPPFALSQCYSSTLRECEQTIVPMISGIVSVLTNLALNTVLIFGYLGAPALGCVGAAIATVVSRYVEFLVVALWTHCNPKKCPAMVGVYRTLRIPAKLTAQMMKKTLPLMLNETLWAAGMALLSQAYSLHGYNVVPAANICSTVSNVFNVAFLAMGTAIGIIVGQLLGANRFEEAVDTDRKLIVFSVAICLIFGGAMALLAPYFPQIYRTEDSIRILAAQFIRIAAVCMPINALANACYFTLRSGGKTLITILFDSFYVCVFTVPLAYILSRYTSAGILTVFLLCQLADIGKCVVGLLLIRKRAWVQNLVR